MLFLTFQPESSTAITNSFNRSHQLHFSPFHHYSASPNMVRVKRGNNAQIPYRPAVNEAVTVELHPVPSGDGVIVKIQPPREPSIPQDHIPCDIVLVIDVSGSMTADAPVPTKPGEEVERSGLSVLDLTKHAARTIVETLNENDRLAIVTFASASTVSTGLV